MKKNNKFRNNGNSNAYSLNYKFDSISPAGKYSGTALDLIKRYNELAKEAHGSGDYVAMEVFRQYAEHYRKIVTEINERKNARVENAPMAEVKEQAPKNENVEPEKIEENKEAKVFHVIEIQEPQKLDEKSAQKKALANSIKKITRRRKSDTIETTVENDSKENAAVI